MTFAKPLLIAFSLAAFSAASAYAADRPSFSSLDRNNDGVLSRAEYEGTAAAAQAGDKEATPRAGHSRASKIVGQNVVNRQGEDLGEIKDLVIDLRTGRVHAAVLEFGGFLGLGEKQFAFAARRLTPGTERDKLVLDVDKQTLERAEGFEKNRWPAMDDSYWTKIEREPGAAAGATAGAAHLIRASTLMGRELQDRSGTDVGEVKDAIVNLADGRIRHYEVDLRDGGMATLAPDMLSPGTGDKLSVGMSLDQLKARGGAARDK